MINGAIFVLLHPFDFGLEVSDALIEFGDRQRIEILPTEQRHRIIGATGEILVGIHDAER